MGEKTGVKRFQTRVRARVHVRVLVRVLVCDRGRGVGGVRVCLWLFRCFCFRICVSVLLPTAGVPLSLEEKILYSIDDVP